jgi:hypothetical protein
MHHLDLDTIILTEGAHTSRGDGVCLEEAVAWWAGEDHTDHPKCVSPVLAAFGRRLNDVLPAAKRQELRSTIPLQPGTAGGGHDEARGYVALDWLIRTYTPAWLDLAGLTAEAASLRELRRIADLVAAQAAGPVVKDARAAAHAAARAAAWIAAWDAAQDVAEAAARAVLKPTVEQLQDSAIVLFKMMIRPGA